LRTVPLKTVPLKRIAIVGSSCSGKTTLSKILEHRLGLRRVELDAINWQPDWQELDYSEFKETVTRETEADEWIVDGNYNSRMNGLVLERADTVIWLNLPFLTVYRRLFSRLYQRVVIGEELWNGNRENLYNTLFSKDSLLYWIPRRYWKSRKKYRRFFSSQEHLAKLIEFTDVESIDTWLESLAKSDSPE
jgi:adenylate kinase family enzyme